VKKCNFINTQYSMHYYTAMEIIVYTRKGPALPVKFPAVLTFIGYKQTNRQTPKHPDKPNLYIEDIVSPVLLLCSRFSHLEPLLLFWSTRTSWIMVFMNKTNIYKEYLARSSSIFTSKLVYLYFSDFFIGYIFSNSQ